MPARLWQRACAVFALCAVSACAGQAPAPCAEAPAGDAVYVVDRGWHTEIGIPADRLAGRLASFRARFAGARVVMFGYGKRTFMTARADRASEYVLGPFPGPAVIEVFALSVLPPAAFGTDATAVVALPRGGDAALSARVWDDLAKDRAGAPLLVGPGRFAGSYFYAARSGYSLGHTCNRWVADALHDAGARIEPRGVVFAGQVMGRLGRQARAAAAARCAAAPVAP
jgi:hypothetical protein